MSPFESTLIMRLLFKHSKKREIDLDRLLVTHREETGHGFYSRIHDGMGAWDEDLLRVVGRNPVFFKVGSSDNIGGAILIGKDSIIESLEVFANGDFPIPYDLKEFEFI